MATWLDRHFGPVVGGGGGGGAGLTQSLVRFVDAGEDHVVDVSDEALRLRHKGDMLKV